MRQLTRKMVIMYSTIMLTMCMLCACNGVKSNEEVIPDVFGLNYLDAIGILEAEGFQVNAIETSVDSFSDKLLYPLEKVDKGTVFKIDDYIIDNNGNLNKNYDVFYDGNLVSEDKSVVVYYSKDDYILEKDNETNTSSNPSTESPTELPTPDSTEENNENITKTEIGSDFKAAMDSYEKFFDEYVTIMKKFKNNPTDMSVLSDYTKYMGQYSDMMQKFEKWEDEDLNVAETNYYIEVQARITKKLLEVAN